MTVPKYYEMMNAALEAIRNLGGSASIGELEDSVSKILKLSEKELKEIHRGNQTKFSYRLAWTRTYLKWYGLLENSERGIWALTSKGKNIMDVDPQEVIKEVRSKKTNNQDVAQADEDITEADTELKDDWKENLLETIHNLPPDSFERLCQRLLRESGFVHVEVTGRTSDGGIDGKGVVKIGGLLSFHIVFQSKRYKGTVSSSIVRDFRGAMVGRADKGLIITTGTFSREARAEAQRDGAPPIDLIDGDELAEKLKILSLGIKVEKRITEVVEIDQFWYENI
ncbi:MAG: restriction endonuclease [Candidatus Zixiibacteriota bacterium]|nr:MAG: restriction endonuclease [candidate division Zixibacteria bacterium]